MDARDGNKCTGAGVGTEGEEQRCQCEGGHGQDRSVGAKADTDRTGVLARRRTRTGQECQRGGGHGQDRSVGAEADTDRAGVSARRWTRTGQDRTDDNMTVSKHQLIREEKRQRKQKRRGHAIIYRTRLGRQDYRKTTIQQASYTLNYRTRSRAITRSLRVRISEPYTCTVTVSPL